MYIRMLVCRITMTLSSKALHVNLERLFNFKMLMSDITGTCFIVPTLLANISISKVLTGRGARGAKPPGSSRVLNI